MSSPSTKWEDVYKVQTTRIAELERENAALLEDREILDWITQSCRGVIVEDWLTGDRDVYEIPPTREALRKTRAAFAAHKEAKP